VTRYHILRETDTEPLGDAVFRILGKVGILCQNREILEALDEAGAEVSFDDQTARFPKRVVEELVETVRRQSEAQSADDETPRFASPGPPHFGTQVAQFLYDIDAGQARPGDKAAFVETVKLASVLHPDQSAGHSLLLSDVPPMVEPLEAALLLAEYAHRPAPAFAWNVRQVDYLIEMGEILGLRDWFSWGAICFAHPLRFDKDVADKFVRRVRSGCATGLTAMPVAGASTPVSPAGFIAVAAAEIVATWLAARAINPDVPLGGSIWAGALDMKTGEVSYCSFDAMFYGFALAEFVLKWTGKEIVVGGGEYCDAKKPGYFAAWEKAYKAMTIAAFTGRHYGVGQGMLEEGKTLCHEQLLLERELAEGVGLLGRGVEVSPQTLDLASVFDVGHGLDRNHLDTEQTLRRYREFLWCPKTFGRNGWRGAETDEKVLQRFRGHAEELKAAYVPPEVDPAKLAAMREVVERGRRDLLV